MDNEFSRKAEEFNLELWTAFGNMFASSVPVPQFYDSLFCNHYWNPKTHSRFKSLQRYAKGYWRWKAMIDSALLIRDMKPMHDCLQALLAECDDRFFRRIYACSSQRFRDSYASYRQAMQWLVDEYERLEAEENEAEENGQEN